MSILLQGLAVVARREAIEAGYPAGVDGYRRDSPANTRFTADGCLVSVAFTDFGRPQPSGLVSYDLSEVHAWTAKLQTAGISYTDFAVVHAETGPGSIIPWFSGGFLSDGSSVAWATGPEPGALFTETGASPNPPSLGDISPFVFSAFHNVGCSPVIHVAVEELRELPKLVRAQEPGFTQPPPPFRTIPARELQSPYSSSRWSSGDQIVLQSTLRRIRRAAWWGAGLGVISGLLLNEGRLYLTGLFWILAVILLVIRESLRTWAVSSGT
jgi:hypothetical protein